MKLPVFDKQADIPKGFEGLFEEKDGKWQAKASETDTLEATLTTLRGEKKDLEKKLKVASDGQADLQRKLDIAEKAGGDVDKVKRELLEKWQADTDKAVKAVQDQLEAANGKLETYEVDNNLSAAFVGAGGRPEKSAAALQLNKRHFKLVDGKLVKLNDKGEVTTEKVEDHFKTGFKKEMPEFYQGTKATGGGAGGGTGGSPLTTDAAEIDRMIANPARLIERANAEGAAK